MLFLAFILLCNFTTTIFTMNTKDLYLDLMKKCLMNSIYQDAGNKGMYNQQHRENGTDWPNIAHTMIGLHRLNNLQFCVEDVLKNNIPGDFIETGVWRGGATIFMRSILKAYNITDKKVFVADSFAGLPPPNPTLYPADANWNLHLQEALAISLPEVQSNFARYDLLDDQVVFIKGFFKDSLPHAPVEQLSILRLDGDLYESTMDALINLYPKLSIGGYVIVDDYHMPCCSQAIHDFRKAMDITDEFYFTADSLPAIYWKRSK